MEARSIEHFRSIFTSLDLLLRIQRAEEREACETKPCSIFSSHFQVKGSRSPCQASSTRRPCKPLTDSRSARRQIGPKVRSHDKRGEALAVRR